MLRIGTIAGSVLVGLTFLVFAQEALPKKGDGGKDAGPVLRSAAVRKALAEQIEIPEKFRNPGHAIPFRIVWQHIDGVLAERKQALSLVVDHTSFKLANMGDPVDLYELPVTFPPFCRTASVQEMLDQSLRQFPMNNATYLIKNGRVEILTLDVANIYALLDNSVAAQFRDVPLKSAVAELADLMGFTVLIDPRCGDALLQPVSLESQNDISARGVLSGWCDMFDLSLAFNSHRVTLMPRAVYVKKLQEQLEETQMIRELQKMQGIDNVETFARRGRFVRGSIGSFDLIAP